MNDFLTERNLEFMILTETWLDNGDRAPVLTGSAPPNFNSMNVSRTNKKHGDAAIVKDSFQTVNVVILIPLNFCVFC